MSLANAFFSILASRMGLSVASFTARSDLTSLLDVSGLDQLHILTSLAYLLLLIGASGVRFIFLVRQRRTPRSLSDFPVILLGYVIPGLIGLLPTLIVERFLPRNWNEAWTMLIDPEFLWVPATQALALMVLVPQMAALSTISRPNQRPAKPTIALLAGSGFWLAFAFLAQLTRTLVAPSFTPEPAQGISFLTATLAAFILPFVSEHVLRGRFLSLSLRKGRSYEKNIFLQALFSGLLTFRLAAFIPATLGAYLYTRLCLKEGRLRPAILAHLIFNLACLFFQAYIIH